MTVRTFGLPAADYFSAFGLLSMFYFPFRFVLPFAIDSTIPVYNSGTFVPMQTFVRSRKEKCCDKKNIKNIKMR